VAGVGGWRRGGWRRHPKARIARNPDDVARHDGILAKRRLWCQQSISSKRAAAGMRQEQDNRVSRQYTLFYAIHDPSQLLLSYAFRCAPLVLSVSVCGPVLKP
jgi:hypothetical protein